MEDQLSLMKSDFFKALAHPTRIKILMCLRGGEVCVCDIIASLGLEQSNVSQHLAILRKENIITTTKVGLKVMYRVKYPEIFVILDSVQELLAGRLRENEALIRQLEANS